jgi:prepilin-type N-terminal cleavage/methylation domain-containing protein
MRISARSGMTLMELIVGVVLTGVMASIGAVAFYSIIDHRRTIVEASVETERASAVREMLRSWINSASIQITTSTATQTQTRTFGASGAVIQMNRVSVNANMSQPTGVTSAVSSGDELTFITNALTPALTPRTRVRLFIDGDPATPETGLSIEYQSSTAAPLQRMQLDSTIVAMSVQFLDRTTNLWYSASQAATITPIATRIWFPESDNVYVHPLLQYPMLFVIGQTAAQQATAPQRGGGP